MGETREKFVLEFGTVSNEFVDGINGAIKALRGIERSTKDVRQQATKNLNALVGQAADLEKALKRELEKGAGARINIVKKTNTAIVKLRKSLVEQVSAVEGKIVEVTRKGEAERLRIIEEARSESLNISSKAFEEIDALEQKAVRESLQREAEFSKKKKRITEDDVRERERLLKKFAALRDKEERGAAEAVAGGADPKEVAKQKNAALAKAAEALSAKLQRIDEKTYDKRLTAQRSFNDSVEKAERTLAKNIKAIRDKEEDGQATLRRASQKQLDKVARTAARETESLNKSLGGLKKAEASIKSLDATTAKAAEDIKASQDKVQKEFRETAAAARRGSSGTTRAVQGLDRKLGAPFRRLRIGLLNLRTAFAFLGGGLVVRQVVSFAGEFEKALADVDTLLRGSAVGIEAYREQLLELSKTTSKDLVDLTRGLYQAISAGIPAVEGAGGAFELLDVAARAAQAGLSSTKDAVDALTTAVNIYGKDGLTAQKASDQLFATVRLGRTTFGQLAKSYGRVANSAKEFGVSNEESLAAIAAITRVVPSTSEAVVQYRQVLTSFVRPTQRTTRLLNELARVTGKDLDFSAATLQAQGLAKTLEQVREVTGGNADVLARLFPRIRGLTGALTLLGGGFDDFNTSLQQIRDAEGDTADANAKQARTFQVLAKQLKNNLNVVLVRLADVLFPKLARGANDFISFLTANEAAIVDVFDKLFQTVEDLAEVFKFLIPLIAESGEVILLAFSPVLRTLALLAAFLRGDLAEALEVAGVAVAVFFAGWLKWIAQVQVASGGLGGVATKAFSLLAKTPPGVIVAAGAALGAALVVGFRKVIESALPTIVEDIASVVRLKVQRTAGAIARGFTDPEDQENALTALARGTRLLVGATEDLRKENIRTFDSYLQNLKTVEDATKSQNEFLREWSNNLSRLQTQYEGSVNQVLILKDALAELEQQEADLEAQRIAAGISGEVVGSKESLSRLKLLQQVQAEIRQKRVLLATNEELAKQQESSLNAAIANGVKLLNDLADRIRLLQQAAKAQKALEDTRGGRRRRNVQRQIADVLGVQRQIQDSIFNAQKIRLENALKIADAEEKILQIFNRQRGAARDSEERLARTLEAIDAQRRATQTRLDQLQQEQDLEIAVATEQIRRRQEDARAEVRRKRERNAEIQGQIRLAQARGEDDRVADLRASLIPNIRAFEQETERLVSALNKELERTITGIRLNFSGVIRDLTLQLFNLDDAAKAAPIDLKEGIDKAAASARDATLSLQKQRLEVEKLSLAAQGQANRRRREDAGAPGIFGAAAAVVDIETEAVAASRENVALLARQAQLAASVAALKNRGAIAERDATLAALDVEEARLQANEDIDDALRAQLQSTIDQRRVLAEESVGVVVAQGDAAVEKAVVAAREAAKALDDELDIGARILGALKDGSLLLLDALKDGAEFFVDLFSKTIIDPLQEALLAPIDKLLGAFGEAVNVLTGDPEQRILRRERTVGEEIRLARTAAERSRAREEARLEAERARRFRSAAPANAADDPFAVFKAAIDNADEILGKVEKLLPRLLERALQVIGERAPEFIRRIVDVLVEAIEIIAENAGEFITPIIETVAEAIPVVIQAIVDALPAIIDAVIDALPTVIQALIASLGPLIAAIPRIVGAIIGSLAENLDEIIIAIGKGLAEALVSLFANFLEDLKEVLAGGTGIGALAGGVAGGGLGFALGGPLGGLIGAGLGTVGGGFIGSLFHDGGPVRASQQNPSAAAAFRKAGALKFRLGGPVPLRQQLNTMMQGDEVAAVLQAGERVLSRQEVAQMGGQAGVNQAVAGGGAGGNTQVNVNLSGSRSEQALMSAILKYVEVSVKTPGSPLRTAVAGVGGGAVGSKAVRGRS